MSLAAKLVHFEDCDLEIGVRVCVCGDMTSARSLFLELHNTTQHKGGVHAFCLSTQHISYLLGQMIFSDGMFLKSIRRGIFLQQCIFSAMKMPSYQPGIKYVVWNARLKQIGLVEGDLLKMDHIYVYASHVRCPATAFQGYLRNTTLDIRTQIQDLFAMWSNLKFDAGKWREAKHITLLYFSVLRITSPDLKKQLGN